MKNFLKILGMLLLSSGLQAEKKALEGGCEVSSFRAQLDPVESVLNAAKSFAQQQGHTQVRGAHVLHAFVHEPSGKGILILQKLGVDVKALAERTHELLADSPVQAQVVSPIFSAELGQILEAAMNISGDSDYVTFEKLLAALSSRADLVNALKDCGLETEDLKAQLAKSVTSQQLLRSKDQAAGSMSALEKYGVDLTAKASRGELGRSQVVKMS